MTSHAPPADGWNVVVTVHDEGFSRTRRVLQRLGTVVETPFYNVLLLAADDIPELLTAVDGLLAADPRLAHDVARILPLSHTFDVRDSTELEQRFETIAAGWLDRLAGCAFHVRLHARGWGKELSRLAEERVLDDVVLRALAARGTPGRIGFDRPDVVIDVEVVGDRAGVALWTREDLDRFPFLRID
jgi:tRNA(Ser,Leu) C12 N-acetylase TAN1